MLYVVAAVVAVLGLEIFLRMRANKLIVQMVTRLAGEMTRLVVETLPKQKMMTAAELQQAFAEQLAKLATEQTSASTQMRAAIDKELNAIRASYAAIFHAFVGHADYYHVPGPSNGRIDWKTIQGCRPIAALAKMMKMERALAEARKGQQDQGTVPDVDGAEVVKEVNARIAAGTLRAVPKGTPIDASKAPTMDPGVQGALKDLGDGLAKKIDAPPENTTPLVDVSRLHAQTEKATATPIVKPSVEIMMCLICGETFSAPFMDGKPPRICRKCAQEALTGSQDAPAFSANDSTSSTVGGLNAQTPAQPKG